MLLRSTLVGMLGLAVSVGCGGMRSGGGHFQAKARPAPPVAPAPAAQSPIGPPPSAPMPTVIAPVAPQPEPPPAIEPPAVVAAPSGVSSYTIKLRNDGETDLLFSTEQGWQPVIFAYVGKPPAARSAQLFPTACTQSCDAADPCAACATTPGLAKSVAVPGASVDVPWDGSVFVYAAASSATKKSCRCWSRRLADPGQYNVKACGLRVPAGGGRSTSTRPTCVETTMSVPANGHSDVSLDFTK